MQQSTLLDFLCLKNNTKLSELETCMAVISLY